jgi:hypothetical protein
MNGPCPDCKNRIIVANDLGIQRRRLGYLSLHHRDLSRDKLSTSERNALAAPPPCFNFIFDPADSLFATPTFCVPNLHPRTDDVSKKGWLSVESDQFTFTPTNGL